MEIELPCWNWQWCITVFFRDRDAKLNNFPMIYILFHVLIVRFLESFSLLISRAFNHESWEFSILKVLIYKITYERNHTIFLVNQRSQNCELLKEILNPYVSNHWLLRNFFDPLIKDILVTLLLFLLCTRSRRLTWFSPSLRCLLALTSLWLEIVLFLLLLCYYSSSAFIDNH